MASNINPSLTPVNNLANFRFWCQKVLPLVYDDSLSYYEVLGKMVVQLNDVIDNVNADTENVLTLKDAFLALQTYVNEFFDDIDQLASYAERAETAQTAANQSAINAASSASNASASSLAAMNAKDAAVAAKQAAETSANTASTAATNANTKASEAAQSAITAQTAQSSASQSATLAATDRSAAQTAASTATTKASEASTSASNAETSANNAEESKDEAETLVNSVRESLDNIQQNTQDISDLKESNTDNEVNFNNITSLNLAKYRDTILDSNQHGRHIVMNKNKSSFKYASANSTARTYTLFSLLLQFNSSPSNFITNLPDGAYIPIINRTNGILSFHAKIKRNDGEPFNLPSITVVFRTTEGRTSGTLLEEGTEPVSEYEFCNSIAIPQNATGAVIAIRSLNSNIEIESECSMLSSYIDTAALGLALSN